MSQAGKRAVPPIRRLRGGIVAIFAAPLLLGACTAVDDWVSQEDAASSQAAQDAERAEAAEFPNLASVPGKPPATTSPEARGEIERALVADRANAEYSGQLWGDTRAGRAAGGTGAGARSVDAALQQARAEQAAGIGSRAAPQAASGVPDAAAAPSTGQGASLPASAGAAPRQLAGVIYFANGSAALRGDDREVLRGIVALHRERGGRIRVIGHASGQAESGDALEHRLANFEMSLRRANAVTATLVALGVSRARLRTEARGDAQPIYDESTPTGEAGNRRAEIYLEN